jgi:hypothetical protein
MRPWRDFFPEVLPFVASDIPDPMLERQLLRSAQKFCETTRAWKVTLDPIITIADEKVYDIELPSLTELVRLEDESKLDGQHLTVWRAGADDRKRFISTKDRKTVELSFSPSNDQEIVLGTTLKPSIDAFGIEDELFDQYSDVIADGAVANINGDPIKKQEFKDRCNVIATQIWRGSAAIKPRVHAHWF